MGSFGKAGASAVAGGMAATGEAALAGAGRAAVSPLRKMADKAGQALRSNFRRGARSSFGAAPEGPAASTGAATAESGAGPASSPSGPTSWAKATNAQSRKTDVQGKREAVSVDLEGRRIVHTKKKNTP